MRDEFGYPMAIEFFDGQMRMQARLSGAGDRLIITYVEDVLDKTSTQELSIALCDVPALVDVLHKATEVR